MYESFEQGKAVSMDVKTVASGLSPPKAGDTRTNLQLSIHFIGQPACNRQLNSIFFKRRLLLTS